MSTQVDPCVPIDRERFHRLLAIELDTAIAYTETSGSERALTAVSLTCVPTGIQLLLDDGVTRKSMTRIILDLERVDAAARSRLLALTVAEFVVASWLELRLIQRAPIAPVAPPPPPEAERRASELAQTRLPALAAGGSDWQLGLAFDLMAFSSALRPIPGVELRLRHRLSGAFWFGVGLQLGRATFEGQLKGERLEVQTTLTSVSFNALYTERLSDFDLSVGLGARVGFIHLTGTTRMTASLMPSSSYAPWSVPVVVLGSAYRAGSHLRLEANLEIGIVTHRASALVDKYVLLWLRDGWGAVSLGLAWAF